MPPVPEEAACVTVTVVLKPSAPSEKVALRVALLGLAALAVMVSVAGITDS